VPSWSSSVATTKRSTTRTVRHVTAYAVKECSSEEEVTIGARLRTLRRWRGKSQVELAGLAGLSPSFLSIVETGQRPLDRRSHIAALASALKVSETDLVGGPHLTPDPLQSDPHLGIPALRVALQTNTLTTPAVDRARPLVELVQLITGEVEPMRRACNYVAAGHLLPDVLDELRDRGVPAESGESRSRWTGTAGYGGPDGDAALRTVTE